MADLMTIWDSFRVHRQPFLTSERPKYKSNQQTKNFGKRFDEKILQELISLGFIEIASNQLKVLQKGKVLLNYITKELLT